MLIATALLALALSAGVALPGDWARRRSTETTADLANLLNVAGVITAVALIATIGGTHGLVGIAAVVIAIAAGQMLANRLADQLWRQH
jgi:hypothetical protein